VLTRDGVPVYLKDIADVRDSTEDRRSFTRINGRPGIRMRVTKQSGTNTVQIAEGVRREIDRINSEVRGCDWCSTTSRSSSTAPSTACRNTR
jgi:hydrophobic/amphiphilic exporter-1 (mainly G- bacteria), HAE1 family